MNICPKKIIVKPLISRDMIDKKVSDYIVEYLISNNVLDVFGYPGGMVTHLMDSFEKNKRKINNHLCYHEQAAAFAACGNSQITNNIGVVYATSGPGATNLITGIGQAFFDSIPVIFITGQVNTYESKAGRNIRQKGFQETDIVSIVSSITKYAVTVSDPIEIRHHLEKAISIAKEGRPGPVLLDIPMNIFRAIVNVEKLKGYIAKDELQVEYSEKVKIITELLLIARRPIILAGAGVDIAGVRDDFRKLVEKIKVPVISSMIAVDLLPKTNKYNFGFVGAYGHRAANFTVMNSDLIIAIGSRMDLRQTGSDVSSFAPNAKIIRLDVDKTEFGNKIKETDINIQCDLRSFLVYLLNNIKSVKKYTEWLDICDKYVVALSKIDRNKPNDYVGEISKLIDDKYLITTDVGQNQVWVSQSFINKPSQRLLFSGGLGSMGYSLPAAIGAYYASKKNVISFCGDGGLQMNIQELQFLAREKIPVKIIVLNNNSLGMIRHFQEMYFNSIYAQTVNGMGYSSPNFCSIAKAYGIKSVNINSLGDIKKLPELLDNSLPVLINVNLGNTTYISPKLAINKPINDQEPLIDRKLFSYLKDL